MSNACKNLKKTIQQKTYNVKTPDIEQKDWYIIDAKNLVLGRIASKIATILLGKHKAIAITQFEKRNIFSFFI